MKKHTRLVLICTLYFLAFISQQANANVNFQKTFDDLLIRHKIPKEHISISVVKLEKEEVWSPFLKVNPEKLRIPASITKILTAITAFETIPSQHQFVTELRAMSKPVDGVLNGPIYLVGSGDPTFVTEKLWLLIHDFSRLGIKKINGDLIFDTSVFDDVKFDKSRSTHNHRAYSSPTSGLTFNWNSLWVRILPTKLGQAVRVYLDPPDSTIGVRNNAKTLNKSTSLLVDRVTANDIDQIIVGGQIKPDDEFSVYRSHTLPAQRAAIQAMNFLKNEGIEVTGQIKPGKAPANSIQVAKVESVMIDEIVKMMMKHSNNLISEMLIKYVDYQENNRPGTLAGGLEILNKTLKKYSKKPFTVVNPSGLTTDNKVSTDFMTDLLVAMTNHPEYYAEFMAAFPRSGIDGTIKKRMTKAKGKIRGKTGLLNGVVSLAGYIHSEQGNLYSFAFIYNGAMNKQGRATDLFDLLAERIALQY
jgi:serine-type D-Ala-D-Ala carboxypeptidase/endopeptidase (penicillin-binding protein 4)